ncbi:TolC family protein [Glycocaulis profundi]|nr:TolC family protein [Glycocaulis profundi]
MKASFVTSAAAAVLLAGCMSVPEAPDSEIAARDPGPLLSAENAAFSAEDPRGDWWRLYESDALDGLMSEAFGNNRQLVEAAATLEQVRAGLGEARAALFPSTTATGSAQYARQPLSGAGGGAPGAPGGGLGQSVETDIYTLGFEAAYELDFFGRVRSSVRAALEEAYAAEAAYEAAALMVAGETARAWADFCAGNAQLEVAQSNLDVQLRSLELTETLYDAGRALRLDVAQAQAAAQAARAAIPSVRSARDGAVFRLATLTGRTPAEMRAAMPSCSDVPRLASPISVGDGASLLARRPDVRQAERQLSAAAARVGVATASLYPTVALGGSVSNVALEPGDLTSDDGLSFSIGPVISWSFPNIAAARARIAQAEAGTDIALARFDQAILTALEETETALTVYAAELERRASLEAALDAAEEAARIARLRYEAGADGFLAVLDAERTLADARTTLAQSEAAAASAEIAVFMALGGRWLEG